MFNPVLICMLTYRYIILIKSNEIIISSDLVTKIFKLESNFNIINVII